MLTAKQFKPQSYQQRELSEMLFHFHLDQAASHMQAMTNTLPMTHEVKQEFNLVQKAMNRIWRKQDVHMQELSEHFADTASEMGDFLQLFMKAPNRQTLIQTIRKHTANELNAESAIIINRQLVEHQQRHLHYQQTS